MECPVCYSDHCACHTLLCGHSICKDCTKQWYTTSPEPDCPMCRAPMNFKGLHRVREKWEDEAYEKRMADHYASAFDRTLECWKDLPQTCMYALKCIEKNLDEMAPYVPGMEDNTIEYMLDANHRFIFDSPNKMMWDDFGTLEQRDRILVSKHPHMRARRPRIMCV